MVLADTNAMTSLPFFLEMQSIHVYCTQHGARVDVPVAWGFTEGQKSAEESWASAAIEFCHSMSQIRSSYELRVLASWNIRGQ